MTRVSVYSIRKSNTNALSKTSVTVTIQMRSRARGMGCKMYFSLFFYTDSYIVIYFQNWSVLTTINRELSVCSIAKLSTSYFFWYCVSSNDQQKKMVNVLRAKSLILRSFTIVTIEMTERR